MDHTFDVLRFYVSFLLLTIKIFFASKNQTVKTPEKSQADQKIKQIHIHKQRDFICMEEVSNKMDKTLLFFKWASFLISELVYNYFIAINKIHIADTVVQSRVEFQQLVEKFWKIFVPFAFGFAIISNI